jgi:hypothetical protein
MIYFIPSFSKVSTVENKSLEIKESIYDKKLVKIIIKTGDGLQLQHLARILLLEDADKFLENV